MIDKDGFFASPEVLECDLFLESLLGIFFFFFLKDETREKAEALLKKLHIQYRRSGTEAVLIAHKLNTTEYLRVIGKPAHLIVSLYEHPSISQRIQNSSSKEYPGEDKAPFIFLLRENCHFDSQLSCTENLGFSFFKLFILNILDIHAAAKEIAEVNEINLEKVWDMLLEKWLCPSTKPGEVSPSSERFSCPFCWLCIDRTFGLGAQT